LSMPKFITNRILATILHLATSITILLLVLWLTAELWYPQPFFDLEGVWEGLKIVTLVDIIIGPTLTLIVFSKEKPRTELKKDLLLIISIQLSALTWGIHTVYQQRPVAIFFWDDSFLTVPASALTNQGYDIDQLRQFGNSSPVILAIAEPNTQEERKVLLSRIKDQNIPPHHQYQLYQPLSNHFPTIGRFGLMMNALAKQNPAILDRIDSLLTKNENTPKEELAIFFLQAKLKNALMVFKKNGTFLGYISIDEENQH